mgnify:CR=1 FL=1
MQLKINWIIYLLIGSNIILNSCEKRVDYNFKSTYVYSNTSNHNIELRVYNESDRNLIREITIIAGDSTSIILYGDGSPAPPFFFDSSLDSIGDSISVVFDEAKYLPFTIDSENSILDSRNYQETKLSKTNLLYRYIFTNEHYENAIPIN